MEAAAATFTGSSIEISRPAKSVARLGFLATNGQVFVCFPIKPRNLSREEQQMHKSSFEKLSHAACGAGIFSLRYLKVRGATVGKGLNIMLSTLVGGAPGVGAHHLPTPTTVTFTRFVPAGQARFERSYRNLVIGNMEKPGNYLEGMHHKLITVLFLFCSNTR